MREWLEDPEAPWWAKLRRAQVHINEVRQRVDALQSAGIWSIEREPAADGCSYRFRLHRADGWAYRFRINRAVPADLLAAVGDAVANSAWIRHHSTGSLWAGGGALSATGCMAT